MAALLDRLEQKRQREGLLTGIVAAAVANFSMCRNPDKPPLVPSDFVPGLPKPEVKAQSPEEMMRVIKAIHAARPENRHAVVQPE